MNAQKKKIHTNYCVEIKVHGRYTERVNRHTMEEADKIANDVRRTGRFNGFKATVVRVFAW